MKTSVIEVHNMLLALSADAVEKRIRKVPGVESVTVNDTAGNATVRYDEDLLDIADIKAAVHQSEYQTADESEPKHVSEHKPAGKRVAVTPPQAAPAPALTPVPAVPKTAAPVPAAPVPAAAGSAPQDKAPPSAPPSAMVAATPKPSAVAPAAAGHQGHEGHTASAVPAAGEAAPDAKPATPAPTAPKAAPLASAAIPAPAAKPSTPEAAAPRAAPDAKSSTPATVESTTGAWKVHALSLATTLAVTYSACAIFDLVFPPFGLLAALAPASPLPISGSALGFLTGFALFTVAGLVLGALYGIASEFWSKRLH